MGKFNCLRKIHIGTSTAYARAQDIEFVMDQNKTKIKNNNQRNDPSSDTATSLIIWVLKSLQSIGKSSDHRKFRSPTIDRLGSLGY